MLPNFSKRQWSTLIIIGLADFANAICVSLQAPFFPQEVSYRLHLHLRTASTNSQETLTGFYKFQSLNCNTQIKIFCYFAANSGIQYFSAFALLYLRYYYQRASFQMLMNSRLIAPNKGIVLNFSFQHENDDFAVEVTPFYSSECCKRVSNCVKYDVTQIRFTLERLLWCQENNLLDSRFCQFLH